jgi:hypothetical protein
MLLKGLWAGRLKLSLWVGRPFLYDCQNSIGYARILTYFLQFCVNGTVSGCSDTLETATDGSYFEACGPTYVDNADENSAIQGLFNTIVSAADRGLRVVLRRN